MLSKFILTIILSSFLPLLNQGYGNFLSYQKNNIRPANSIGGQVAGDKTEGTLGPEKINNKNLGVKISAFSAVVVDEISGAILFEKNSELARPIASITKLMTALTFLDTQPDLKKEIEIMESDLAGTGKTNLLVGEKIKLEDLFYLSLINSDNNATLALVRSTGLSEEEFIRQINVKARGLGLWKAHFADPVGLSKENIATAQETAKILDLALRHALIKKILPLKDYTFTVVNGETRQVKNTNQLLNSYLNVLGGKTGYTEEAGYCFAGAIKLKNEQTIITVVLDSATDTDRFNDTKALVNWVEENYKW